MSVKVYWHPDGYNFGDTLTPWLFLWYGAVAEFTRPPECVVVAVGSVLDSVPEDYTGMVWGTGLINDRPHVMPNAKILGVRGRLTAQRIGHPDANLGDPGLLVSRFLPAAEKTHVLGLVPHKIHVDHPTIQHLVSPDVILIDPGEPAAVVAEKISSCSAIVSTSLHGLVVADSYGIPAAWADLADRPLSGSGAFKFYDYESALSAGSRRVWITRDTTMLELMGKTKAANRERVEHRCDILDASIRAVVRDYDEVTA